jgi:hypothetical protein
VLEKNSCVKEGYENCHNGNKKDRTTLKNENEAKCTTIPRK